MYWELYTWDHLHTGGAVAPVEKRIRVYEFRGKCNEERSRFVLCIQQHKDRRDLNVNYI